jgi:dipeptidase E
VPHYDPGNAEVEKAVEYYSEHHIPFVALRDGEALVVEGDRRRVVS